MPDRPNIILIMADEFRGDCLGFAGHPDVKTPYLDSLASESVYFPNAYTPCPSCVPARAVMHTGLTPRSCGRVGYQDKVDWNYKTTLAGELARTGYYCQCVGKMHVHPLRNTLGYHNVELHDGYLHAYRTENTPAYESQREADDYFHWLRGELGVDADVTDTGLDCNSWLARPWVYDEKYHPTNWVTDRGIDFLRRRDPRLPFFLTLSYVRPHAPYDAPRHYFDMYESTALRAPLSGDWDDKARLEREGLRFVNTTGPSDPEYIRRQQIGYYACISHLDNQIGRFLIALIERGLMNNTVILFTSDHGEMLSDHCFCRKSLPYQGSIRVPMFIRGPESIVGRRGTNTNVAALQDVLPTLLEAAGAEIPPRVEGQSLPRLDRESLHGEHSYGQLSNHFIVTRDDKYVWFSQTGREQYFRLDTDPNESHDAIADPQWQQRISELRQELIQTLANSPEGYSDGSQLIAGRPPRTILDNATLPNY